jgi:NitT/TauT family transport system permease protein
MVSITVGNDLIPVTSSPGRARRAMSAVGGGLRFGFRNLVAVAIVFGLWEVLPRLGLISRTFVPPFSTVCVAWWQLLVHGPLLADMGASLERSLIGFGLALAICIPLGLFLGWYPRLARFLNPVIELFRNTAALALLPVFILTLGIGQVSKIAVILYACAWPILLNTISGVRSVDPLLVKSARSIGLPPIKLFQKVFLPAALPTIFTGIRLAGAVSILVLLAAEIQGATSGLGFLINTAQTNFQIPQMYAGILTISVIGLVFNQVLVQLERHFSSWRGSPGQ